MNNFRSPKILRLASEAPHCMAQGCFEHNYGQVVAAHSNALCDGKGMGIKAHDIPAYLCKDCHSVYDGHAKGNFTQADFYQAVYNTFLWLLQNKHLEVK